MQSFTTSSNLLSNDALERNFRIYFASKCSAGREV